MSNPSTTPTGALSLYKWSKLTIRKEQTIKRAQEGAQLVSPRFATTLLKMGRYYSTPMRHY